MVGVGGTVGCYWDLCLQSAWQTPVMGWGRANTVSTAGQREINHSSGTNPGGFQQALFDEPLLELLHVNVDLCEILARCGGGNEDFFPLLMCCLFFLVGVWCQTVGSPCGLPRQPAASCASMNIKKEKRTSEFSIPERKKKELNGENKWLHCLQNLGPFTFSPKKFHLGHCERAERAVRPATVIFLGSFFFLISFFPFVPGF